MRRFRSRQLSICAQHGATRAMRASVAAAAATATAAFLTATTAYLLYRRRRQQSQKLTTVKPIILTLIGFGSVNRALAKLIASKADFLKRRGYVVKYRAIVARHGSWEAQPGCELDASIAAALVDSKARLDGSTPPPPGVTEIMTPSVQAIRDIISRTPLDAITGLIEAIDVSYDDGEPAATYLADGLRRGSHAISANKGPVVHHRASLLALAKANGVRYLHESAFMDGVPIFSLWAGGMRPGDAQLKRFRGCPNSTTGVILSGMANGESMEQALRRAQDAGIAEADPSGDLRGYDAAVKVVSLAIALGMAPSSQWGLSDVAISGMEGVTTEEAVAVKARGNKLKLVAGAEYADFAEEAAEAASAQAGGVQWVPLSERRQQMKSGAPPRPINAYVRVEEVRPGDPLYGLEGADSAVTFFSDLLAPVTVVQSGSEVTDTAFGEWADLMRAVMPEAV